MARAQSPPILAQLRSARSLAEQSAALRALKNEIVGHIQKKETWISLGVLEPIVQTLSSSRSSAKLNGKGSRLQLGSRPLSEEDGAKLQALQLLASFANGGPAFLMPLHAARALPAIISHISPYSNAPQIVVAALRALTDIADAAILAPSSSPLAIETIAEQIFSPQNLESLNAILSISSSKHLAQSQVTLASGLIPKLCGEEKQRNALMTAGVLDSLAARLASFAVSEGFVVPGANLVAERNGLADVFPEPAPSNAKLGPILDAITTIIGDSKYRANRLVLSPAILAVFPSIRIDPLSGIIDPRLEIDYGLVGDGRCMDLTAMDFVLPAVPMTLSRHSSASHSSHTTPDLSDSQTRSRDSNSQKINSSIWDNAFKSPLESEAESEDVECPIIPWLVHLVRSRSSYERLMAASVLASLYKAGLGSKSFRETSLGLLVVPILVEMIAENSNGAVDPTKPGHSMRRVVLERAPFVLARLIIDCDNLQKAAFDSLAVHALTKLLKRSFTPVELSNQPHLWSPHPNMDIDSDDGPPALRLGERGVDAELAHRIKVREASLQAISALAAGKEDYRKSFMSEDLFMGFVAQSLTLFPRKPTLPSKDRSKDEKANESPPNTAVSGYGTNPLSVIIAGCHVIRMMSRSVSIMRTAIVDYGVYLPVLQFAKHPDVDVQIAATATLANMVLEVSPVREPLIEKGVMRVLCEHAHSDNPALCLNALWALKHFIHAVEPDLKRACLERLEPGWLVQLIRDDTQDASLSHARMKGVAGDDMDEDVDTSDIDEPLRWVYGVNGAFHELDTSESTRLQEAENRLAAIRESELNPARRARNDDVAIQEQGLDFIRNIIGHPGPGTMSDTPNETVEIVDYLFSELGQDRLFDILASKLRPKVLSAFSRRTSVTGRDARIVYPQAQIIVPVIYILVHIAASDTRHKQLIIAQTELLKLLAQNALSKDRDVRAALCHLVANLTMQDDSGESDGCRPRAAELKKLGFLNKMEMLRQEDRDLDVRERAKQAAWHLEQALLQSY